MTRRIKIKRVYEAPALDDGRRVLVDRIWPRGLTKDAAAIDHWAKDVAPSTALRKWFGHDPARWEEFEARYRAELAANSEAVRALRDLCTAGHVTLVFAAHDPEHNQAVVLQKLLREKG